MLDVYEMPFNRPMATHIALARSPSLGPKNAHVILEPRTDWPPNGLAMIICQVPSGRVVLIIKREKNVEGEEVEIPIQEAPAGSIIAISTNVHAMDHAVAFQKSTAQDYLWMWCFHRQV